MKGKKMTETVRLVDEAMFQYLWYWGCKKERMVTVTIRERTKYETTHAGARSAVGD